MLGGKIKNIVYIVCYLTTLLSSNYNYQIYLWSLNVAEVNITTSSIKFDNTESTKIVYEANTKGIYNYLYMINNVYEVIIDKQTNSILSYKKFINQPNLIDTLYSERSNGKTIYSNVSDYVINNNSMNIFSLIYSLNTQPDDNFINKRIILDRDGDEFECKIDKADNNVGDLHYVSINKIKNNNLIDKTDIFSWALFKGDVERKVWINDYNNLYKCQFTSGLMNFTAKKSSKK